MSHPASLASVDRRLALAPLMRGTLSCVEPDKALADVKCVMVLVILFGLVDTFTVLHGIWAATYFMGFGSLFCLVNVSIVYAIPRLAPGEGGRWETLPPRLLRKVERQLWCARCSTLLALGMYSVSLTFWCQIVRWGELCLESCDRHEDSLNAGQRTLCEQCTRDATDPFYKGVITYTSIYIALLLFYAWLMTVAIESVLNLAPETSERIRAPTLPRVGAARVAPSSPAQMTQDTGQQGVAVVTGRPVVNPTLVVQGVSVPPSRVTQR